MYTYFNFCDQVWIYLFKYISSIMNNIDEDFSRFCQLQKANPTPCNPSWEMYTRSLNSGIEDAL